MSRSRSDGHSVHWKWAMPTLAVHLEAGRPSALANLFRLTFARTQPRRSTARSKIPTLPSHLISTRAGYKSLRLPGQAKYIVQLSMRGRRAVFLEKFHDQCWRRRRINVTTVVNNHFDRRVLRGRIERAPRPARFSLVRTTVYWRASAIVCCWT
jgi:hypothetical protein